MAGQDTDHIKRLREVIERAEKAENALELEKEHASSIESSLEDSNGEITRLKQRLEASEKQRRDAEATSAAKEASIADLRLELEDEKGSAAVNRSKSERREAELGAALQARQESDRAMGHLKVENKNIRSDNKGVSTALKEAETKVRSLTEQLAARNDAAQQAEAAQIELAEERERTEDLRLQIEALKETITFDISPQAFDDAKSKGVIRKKVLMHELAELEDDGDDASTSAGASASESDPDRTMRPETPTVPTTLVDEAPAPTPPVGEALPEDFEDLYGVEEPSAPPPKEIIVNTERVIIQRVPGKARVFTKTIYAHHALFCWTQVEQDVWRLIVYGLLTTYAYFANQAAQILGFIKPQPFQPPGGARPSIWKRLWTISFRTRPRPAASENEQTGPVAGTDHPPPAVPAVPADTADTAAPGDAAAQGETAAPPSPTTPTTSAVPDFVKRYRPDRKNLPPLWRTFWTFMVHLAFYGCFILFYLAYKERSLWLAANNQTRIALNNLLSHGNRWWFSRLIPYSLREWVWKYIVWNLLTSPVESYPLPG